MKNKRKKGKSFSQTRITLKERKERAAERKLKALESKVENKTEEAAEEEGEEEEN